MKRTLLKRGGMKVGRLVRKPSRIAYKASKRPATRRRRKKGELTKLKEKLWLLCREIVKQRGGYKCYTCGKIVRKKGGLHTGHYITSSSCSPELRFDIKNLARQCYNCNINKSGNTLRFQKNLIRDYGLEYVEELWDRNEATKGKPYSLQYFKDKIAEYQLILENEAHVNSHPQSSPHI